ncbi:MAG: cytochrome b/b6 domain-containing protein [Brumimicrobium sp.]
METVHKWGIYWFPIFIVLHLLGALLAEFSTKKGITSKMIGGD